MKGLESVKKFIRRASDFGFLFALKTRLAHSSAEKRNKITNEYLENEFLDIINEYKEHTSIDDRVERNEAKIVWLLWWQEDDMPLIVAKCIRNMYKKCEGYDIRLLNRNNYQQYVQLPDYIVDKVENKTISLTHLSDIIRFYLLSHYGGLWCDATIWLSDDLSNHPEVMNSLFYSQKFRNEHAYDENEYNIATGRWAGFFQATNLKNNPLYELGLKMFYYYWSKHNRLIDYFLIDFVINIIYNKLPFVREEISKNRPNNKQIFFLGEHLAETDFPSNIYKEITSDTFVHKLSYKSNISVSRSGAYMSVLAERISHKSNFSTYLNEDDAFVYFALDCGESNLRMYAEKTEDNSNYIVEVVAKKFINIWLRSRQSNQVELLKGGAEAWKNDRKYINLAESFKQSNDKPVPLASFQCGLVDGTYCGGGFLDGVTRTLYLLANGVEVFPVRCDSYESAEMLSTVAGNYKSSVCAI